MSGLALSACSSGLNIPDFRNLTPVSGPVGPVSSPVTAPVVAPAPVSPPEVRLVTAIEGQGCVLNANNAGAVQLAANLTQPELISTISRLEELGRVQATGDGGIRVITERCSLA